MISMLINRLTAVCRENKLLSESQEDYFRYGMELLLFSFLSTVSYLLLGVVFGKGSTVLWILITMIPLQSFGGGYHALSHLRCYFITLACLALSVFLVETAAVHLLWLAIPGGVSILLLAPIEHKNAPFSKAFAARMRRIVRVLLCVFMILAVVLQESSPHISACMAMGVASSGISIAAAAIQQRWFTKA